MNGVIDCDEHSMVKKNAAVNESSTVLINTVFGLIDECCEERNGSA